MPQHTILTNLRRHVESQGDQTAYIFLKSDTERISVTYRELDQRAQMIARHLLDNASKGDRALLMYQPGLEFIEAFLGCLYAGIVAAPAYPPRRNRTADRLLSIAGNCNPSLLLCSAYTLRNVEGDFANSLPGAQVVITDRIDHSGEWSLPEVTLDDTAFLQYTSGSTADPKGVIVSHYNIAANEETIKAAFRHGPGTSVCGWLPLFHDMGLIGNVLQPLFIGCRCVLMSPVSFLSQPIRWLRAISEFQSTTSGGPNFAYDHCVNMITPEQSADLDLSSWSLAFNGSEPVQQQTLRRFAERFAPNGFRETAFFPCYGLAEATLYVSGGFIEQLGEPDPAETRTADDDNNPLSAVSCGPLGDMVEAEIVDAETLQPKSPGEIGEIWIRGAAVSAGYWGNEQLTAESFAATIQGDASGAAYFRTGDLGYMKDGELYVTGRLKDLIIVRGRNIYPQDIEAVIEKEVKQSAANSVAAFAIQVDGNEQIAVVMEGSRLHVRLAKALESGALESDEELQAAMEDHIESMHSMRKAIVADFDLRVDHFAYLAPGQFPRTSSGKVQRVVCKKAFESGSLPFLELPECVTSLNSNVG